MLDVKIKFRLNPSPIGGCGEDAWIFTYNNSRIGLAKLIIFLRYFYLFMIALYVDWVLLLMNIFQKLVVLKIENHHEGKCKHESVTFTM